MKKLEKVGERKERRASEEREMNKLKNAKNVNRARKNAKRAGSVVILIIVILFMVGAGIYWLTNSEKLWKRSDLVGDGICGNLPSTEGQNNCCAEVHGEDIIIACEGGWEYVSGIKQCQYVCNGEKPVCPEDARECSDGSVRERDAGNECEFDEC